jgi:hypothetical protein
VTALKELLHPQAASRAASIAAALASETWAFKADQFVAMCAPSGQKPHA